MEQRRSAAYRSVRCLAFAGTVLRPFVNGRDVSGGLVKNQRPYLALGSGRGRCRAGWVGVQNLSGADRQRQDPKTHARQRDHQNEHRELAPKRLTAFGKDPLRLYVPKVNADDVAEQDETNLNMPHETCWRRVHGLTEELSGAEKVPSRTERVGNEWQEPRRIGEEQRKIMTEIIDESDRNQRKTEQERPLAQPPFTPSHHPDKKEVDREVNKGREPEHGPLPIVVNLNEETIWLVDGPG